MMTRILAVLAVLLTAGAVEKPYLNYKLLEITSPRKEHLVRILDNKDWVDVFSEGEFSAKVMVPPARLHQLVPLIRDNYSNYTVLHHNMQALADEDYRYVRAQRRFRRQTDIKPDLERFLPLEDMYKFQEKVLQANPRRAFVTRETIGKSLEGRDINILKFSADSSGKKKRTIFIDAGIHAREWIAPATANYFIYQLAFNEPVFSDLLMNFDWVILPMLNPDGYLHTFNAYRYWRKNRRVNTGSSCRGVDLNRNFGYPSHLPGVGGSLSPCSDVFSGKEPFTEPESQALRDYLLKNKDIIKAYFSLHSFGQYILYPWGYTRASPPNAANLKRVADAGNSAMGDIYRVGTAAQVLYPAAGASDDWAYGKAQIQFSYTMELPPTNSFTLPKGRIVPYASQAWNGMKAMVQELTKMLPGLTNPYSAYTSSNYLQAMLQHYIG